jgi:hypothetical protein
MHRVSSGERKISFSILMNRRVEIRKLASCINKFMPHKITDEFSREMFNKKFFGNLRHE